jgi:hypothetical protein
LKQLSPSALPGKFFSFLSFGKLIILLLLHACVSGSRMHATVASRVTGLDQWPNLFFFLTMQHKLKK